MVRKLDRELEPVSYIGGIELSFLDVYIFAGLYDRNFFQLTREEYNAVPNIARWYTQIEYHLRDYPELKVLHIDLTPLPKKEKTVQPKEDKKSEKGGKKKKDDKLKESKNEEKTESKKDSKKGGGDSKKKELSPDELFQLLDLRVGKVVEASHHADSDKLFVERVDVGEANPRTICSGLRPFMTLEEFSGRSVLVICNLKARKVSFKFIFRGFFRGNLILLL